MITRHPKYRGWSITYDINGPATGTWRAERYGIGLSHNSHEAIKLMVDGKIEDMKLPMWGYPRTEVK